MGVCGMGFDLGNRSGFLLEMLGLDGVLDFF